MAADPKNPLPLKNLGAIFGHEGGSLRAPSYLRQSNECNPQGLQTVYGLAFARDSIGPAQKHSPAVLEMEAPKDLHSLTRNGLREMADLELKARGPRKDGGLLSGWIRRLFSREVAAGSPGDHFRDQDAGAARGRIINDPKETHVLRAACRGGR